MSEQRDLLKELDAEGLTVSTRGLTSGPRAGQIQLILYDPWNKPFGAYYGADTSCAMRKAVDDYRAKMYVEMTRATP